MTISKVADSFVDTRNERCVEDIREWVNHVVTQVEVAGKEMVEMAGILSTKLEDEGESQVVEKRIKFIPNAVLAKLRAADLGFLAIDNILPKDFQLDMVTMLPEVQVGNTVSFVLSCRKKVSSTILSFLQYSVLLNNKTVPVKIDLSQLQFVFSLSSAGEYHVTAQLYGQHVPGSPLTVPVAASVLPGLAQLGLVPLPYEQVADVKALVVGCMCVAKWSNDMVWYRARVDKVQDEMVEVTFVDYGNKEAIAKRDVVKNKGDIPPGEDVDVFVVDSEVDVEGAVDIKALKKEVDISIGDLVIAKWDEDKVWYNAKVVKLKDEDGIAEVSFLDYGNTAEVDTRSVVKFREEIPLEDFVDDYVVSTSTAENAVDLKEDPVNEEGQHVTPPVPDDSGANSVVSVGCLVVAKWEEDQVWYNAKVENVTEEGYVVKFVDYGNSVLAKHDHVLMSSVDIPAGESIDECVDIVVKDSEVSPSDALCWAKGSLCIAQWSEDNIWYNARVEREDMDGSGGYEVTFTDYGNTDIVAANRIVAAAADIPADQGDMVDECVKKDVVETTSVSTIKVTDIVSTMPVPASDTVAAIPNTVPASDTVAAIPNTVPASDTVAAIPNTVPADAGWIIAGTSCLACWQEDDIWYNAVVERIETKGEYFVTFTDYGNQDTVTADRLVAKAEDIPDVQRNMVDENVEMKMTDQKLLQDTVLESREEEKEVSKILPPFPWAVGMSVVACWSEDSVWYNAVVDTITKSGEIQVTFIDYGNAATVTSEAIVASAGEIPTDQLEMVDECVKFPPADLSCGGDNPEQGNRESQSSVAPTESKQEPSISLAAPTSSPGLEVAVGSTVIAKWAEDDIWYNAVVEGLETSGNFNVLFIDYGNTATVSRDDMVATAGDIPAEQRDMVDECVIMPDYKAEDPSLTVGKAVIARWCDDSVWYNAVVDSVDTNTGYADVTFVDYGNSATVSVNHIVKLATEIPVEELEMVDHLVELESVVLPPVITLATIKEEEESTGNDENQIDSTPILRPWVAGDMCIAQWAEDEVWYNAEVLEVRESIVLVRFTDYGNEAGVSKDAMVLSVEEISGDDAIDECVEKCKETESISTGAIPPSLQCCLCGGLCRRGMRLTCSTINTCWGCAVKEINTSRTCWQCGEKDISTETHLVQDSVLRAFVQQFVETGKLDPVHVQALKNAKLEPVPSEIVPEEVTKNVAADVKETEPRISSVVTVAAPAKSLAVGALCIARWSEDSVWYNARVEEVEKNGTVLVNFTDYGNSDLVKPVFIITDTANLPSAAEVDPHVKIQTGLKAAEPSVDTEFLSLATVGADSVREIVAKQVMTIKDLKGPVGLAVVGGSVAVVCKSDNSVRMFSLEGQFLWLVRGQREFVKPADILVLHSGEFLVRDELGIQMFDQQGKFLKVLGSGFINKYYGLAEDDAGRIVTINTNTGGGGCGKLTEVGETDVFYIDTTTGDVVKRVELIDIVGEEKTKSACRFLACAEGKLYIVDMGLDCVYVLFQKDGEEQADVFGSSGSNFGEFRDPAGLVVDSAGTIIVVDSKNNRLQLINKDFLFCGLVKVPSPLSRPSGIFWDSQTNRLLVSNYAQHSAMCYQL